MKIPLRKKLFLTHLALLALITAAASVITDFELQRYYKDRLFQQLKIQLDEIEFLLANGAFTAPSGELDYGKLVEYAGAGAIRLTLIDSSGVLRFDSHVPRDSLDRLTNHFDRPEVVQARATGMGRAERQSDTVPTRLFYVAKLVAPARAGTGLLKQVTCLRLAVPLTEIEAAVRELRWQILAGGSLALLLTAVAGYWVARRLTDPIHRLAEVVDAVRMGNLDAHFQRSSNDEIGDLADLLNEMLAKLRDDLKQMHKLENMRTQFLGNVSHELRTPIFALQGYLETLLYGSVNEPQTQRMFLEKAYRQAGRLNNLLTDLIDISRIESGEMKMSFRYFDVAEWLARQIPDLQNQANQYEVTVSLKNGADLGSVIALGDRERLTQVITNLASNAIKYNVPGGRVELGYQINKKEVEIYVADTGRGIPAEHLPRIFERFYRVDRERSRDVGGTGLGLAIVKHIVEAHGSHVKVKSEVGKGSVFSFSLKRNLIKD
ncbi:MAG: ATP-binding protein [candidate division KSB1 bacterium]|nr:ATP-binding protein [candidate division KSB1 bacterium]MDZ7273302.1 ATP-binding protein [candidate division KSB1 bacterium]MDZ7285404.1 ATP-binding protein [candidate division KSB1 bacterium]MDZ7298436.1 ATP-binding protein [candidate division KSB1 bacterium]MDZ7308533.1 ATP-binding protein [candidate division KSB1 bacterium]